MSGVNFDYYTKFDDVLQEYMPNHGEGDTLASQTATAVNKLIYKWYNDGDVYDNHYGLDGWENDISSYANWLYNYLKEPVVMDILEDIYSAETEDDYESILQGLADYCLDDEKLSSYSELPARGSVYNCKGPFSFKYTYYDDEEEDE